MTPHKQETDEEKCRYCWNKRFYTVIYGIHGSEDMGGDGFDDLPTIHKIACSKCNRGNKMKLPGVRAYWWKV